MTVIAIGQNYWGQGDDDLEALFNFREQGGAAKKGYRLITFGEGSEFKGVDGMGRVHWEGSEPDMREIAPR